MENFKKEVGPLLKKFKERTDKIFLQYNKEVKAKNITSISEQNKLWREKYKERLEKIEKEHNEKYKKLWYKFFKK